MTRKLKHPIEALNDKQLRLYIVRLEEQLDRLQSHVYRLEEERRASERGWVEYKDRVGEMNEALRRDVKTLLRMFSPDAALESVQEWGGHSVGGPVEANHAESLVPTDSIEVMRTMTRGVIRSYFASGKLVSESAIAAMVRKTARESVQSVVASEFGIDRYGEVKSGSKTMQLVKERVHGIVEDFLDTEEFASIIDAASEKAKNGFLSKNRMEFIRQYAADTMRSSFHDRLSRRVSDVAAQLADVVISHTFEQALLEEMPFLQQFKALIKLGLEEPAEDGPDF